MKKLQLICLVILGVACTLGILFNVSNLILKLAPFKEAEYLYTQHIGPNPYIGSTVATIVFLLGLWVAIFSFKWVDKYE